MPAFAHYRLLGLLTALAALGCGTQSPQRCDRSESITLQLQPAKHLNPDRAGLPRSVVLRVYQLNDAKAFRTSSFERLWRTPASTALPDQVIALPGRRQTHALRRNPKARYLAIAANFRERRSESDWRAWVRLPEPQNPCETWPGQRIAPLKVVLSDYALKLR